MTQLPSRVGLHARYESGAKKKNAEKETRNDLDHNKLAYYGLDDGAYLGGILAAIEKRIKVLVLAGGGVYLGKKLPDEINFAPRVAVPVLMINGRYDFWFPLEASQNPMFRLLGAPEKDKRHAVFGTGHMPSHDQLIKEVLDGSTATKGQLIDIAVLVRRAGSEAGTSALQTVHISLAKRHASRFHSQGTDRDAIKHYGQTVSMVFCRCFVCVDSCGACQRPSTKDNKLQ